ncbi:hypothetical protein [Streptomyces sp. NPDC048392]|uniref:hypothetical protein n=1 Tax=Streptomyces sp. NPDC048392 TaxID=3365543 RepID=UPI0037113899
METRYLARLRFVANGPAVQGEWELVSTARDRYTEWVGLYSKDPKVVVWLIEETCGRERALRTWTAEGETVS